MNKSILAILFLLACTPKPEPDLIETEYVPFDNGHVDEVGFFDTRITSYWIDRPTIKICPGAGITESRVRTALSFWEDIGYTFGPITRVSHREACLPQRGEIVFRLPTQQEITSAIEVGRLGVTKTSFSTLTRSIVTAEIFFQHIHASSKLKIVEHEIGHALGWRHHNRKGHIMHHTLESTGWSSVGVEKRDYDQRVTDLVEGLSLGTNR